MKSNSTSTKSGKKRKKKILIFIILLTPSYYLHAFSSNTSFIKRLMVLALAVAVVGVVIYYFSETEYPFTTLLNYGILAPYILIILFIITVSHEIVALFVNFTRRTAFNGYSTASYRTSDVSRIRIILISLCFFEQLCGRRRLWRLFPGTCLTKDWLALIAPTRFTALRASLVCMNDWLWFGFFRRHHRL